MTINRLLLVLALCVCSALSVGAVPQCTGRSQAYLSIPRYDWSYIPQLTPDGQTLVLERGGRIYSIDVTTGQPVSISLQNRRSHPAFQVDYAPTVSPDGSRIAFVTHRLIEDRHYNFEIVTSDFNGDNVNRLTNSKADEINPAWSPDGTRIAFLSDRDSQYAGQFKLFVMESDGSEAQSILPEIHVAQGPIAWSPNSDKLAFVEVPKWLGGNDYEFTIHVVALDGAARAVSWNNLIGFFRRGAYPQLAWSPDSSLIAIAIPNGGIFLADSTSQALQTLAGGADPLGLFWSPSLELLYFDGHEVWAFPNDGGGPYLRLVPEGSPDSLAFLLGAGDLYMSMSPDGSRIAAYFRGSLRLPTVGIIDLDGSVTQLIEASDWPDFN